MARTCNILSAAAVAKALRAGKPVTLKDGGSLALIVTGKGQGRWLFRGRLPGTKNVTDVTIGYIPSVSLSEARALRDEARKQLRNGINPNQARREAKAAELAKKEADKHLFLAVAYEYQERKNCKPVSLQTERILIDLHMRPLHNLPIAEIRRLQHLKPLLDGIVKQGKLDRAQRVAQCIGRIFRFAIDCGYIEASPGEGLLRLVPKQAPGEKKHFSAATKPEAAREVFRALWTYCDKGRSGPHICAALKCTVYLPLRNSSLIGARWEDIDFDAGTWHFPETKNYKPYTLPMTSQVRAILESLYEMRTAEEEFVFASDRRGKSHVSNKGMNGALRAAGIAPNVQTLHGFRATFESLACDAGLPKNVCKEALFHTIGNQTERAYRRNTYFDPLKVLLQWYDDCVDNLRTGQEVPPMPEELRGKFA